MRKNYDSIDVVKLIMSLFVVAIHTNLLNGALFPTIRLAVPVFLILTGFFTFSKLNTAPLNERKQLLWKIEKRYLKLYLFWFIVLLPVTVYVRKYYTYDFIGFLTTFLKNLIWGSTFQASWYLMACVLAIPVVFQLSRCNSILQALICVALYLFATSLSKYNNSVTGDPTLNAWYLSLLHATGSPYTNVFIAIPYIMTGKVIAENKLSFIKRKHSICGFLLCYFGLLLEFYLAKSKPWFQYNCDCWFMLAPAAVFLILFLVTLKAKFKNTSFMRASSTIIYCSHLPASMIVGKLLEIIHIADKYKIILFTITMLCSLTLSVCILKLEKHKNFSFLKISH